MARGLQGRRGCGVEQAGRQWRAGRPRNPREGAGLLPIPGPLPRPPPQHPSPEPPPRMRTAAPAAAQYLAERLTAPSAHARPAASALLLNGSLYGSLQPGPRRRRRAAGRAPPRTEARRGDPAAPKRSVTCGILDVSEGDWPPRRGQRALPDCGHLTRIPGRAATANRDALGGRCGQWAGARGAAGQWRRAAGEAPGGPAPPN